MSYVNDIAYGKRVKTPRMKRAERVEKVKSFAKKTVSTAGKSAKSFGKDLYETGKYIHKDIKSTRPKKIKNKKKRKTMSYPKYVSGNFNFGRESIGI